MLELWQLALSYFIIVIGFLIGILIRKKTGDEVEQGRKFIILGLKLILILLMIFTLIIIQNGLLMFILGILFGFILAYFLRYLVMFLGLLVIGFSNDRLFLLVSSINFIAILIYGSLFKFNKKRFYLNIVLALLPLILFLILNIKINELYSNLLNGIGLGALLLVVYKIERYI